MRERARLIYRAAIAGERERRTSRARFGRSLPAEQCERGDVLRGVSEIRAQMRHPHLHRFATPALAYRFGFGQRLRLVRRANRIQAGHDKVIRDLKPLVIAWALAARREPRPPCELRVFLNPNRRPAASIQ
jgi:hypothetical protein